MPTVDGMSDTFTPSPAGTAAEPAPAPAPVPRSRIGGGAIAAIIVGGVVSLGLVFGGGMATAWAIGPLGGPTSAFSGGPGHPPQLGDGTNPRDDRGMPGQGQREDDSGSSDSSSS